MPRPLSRAQALQNAAFLAALRRTGNARAAARQLGVHRATFTKRRAKHPGFAAAWDAALAIAHAHLNAASARAGEPRRAAEAAAGDAIAEPRIIRTRGGRLQLRRARPGGLTRAAEQAFLAALGATANVRLSAAAAGFSHAAFYHRRRTSAGFAREMRLALEQGYERLEGALLESAMPASYADDAWRHNDPPPLPPMSTAQALQLLYLHQKEARLWSEPDHIKRRRGESSEAHSFRLSAMYEARLQRDREAFEVAEAARRAGRGAGASPHAPPPPALPDLAQVTGWSKARPEPVEGAKPHAASRADDETANARPGGESPADDAEFTSASGPVYHDDVALFGGWRLRDWKGKARR